MEITDVKIFPVNEDKLKAFVSIILDNCFVISDIKIIHGSNGLFVSMPSKKRKNGTFRDIAHPLNNETRRKMEERIFEEYYKSISGEGESIEPRTLSESSSRQTESPREVSGTQGPSSSEEGGSPRGEQPANDNPSYTSTGSLEPEGKPEVPPRETDFHPPPGEIPGPNLDDMKSPEQDGGSSV